jgi:hypothetical protein
MEADARSGDKRFNFLRGVDPHEKLWRASRLLTQTGFFLTKGKPHSVRVSFPLDTQLSNLAGNWRINPSELDSSNKKSGPENEPLHQLVDLFFHVWKLQCGKRKHGVVWRRHGHLKIKIGQYKWPNQRRRHRGIGHG